MNADTKKKRKTKPIEPQELVNRLFAADRGVDEHGFTYPADAHSESNLDPGRQLPMAGCPTS